MQGAGTERISMTQMVLIFVTFEIGSSVMVGVAPAAAENAWLAVLCALAGGFVLLSMYLWLVNYGNGKNLYQLFEDTLSRWGALPVAILYIGYFLYMSAVVMRDMIELLDTAVYPASPNEFIAFTFILVIAYILYLGVEVFARTTEMIMPYFMLFFLLMLVLLIINKSIHFSYLRPVLAEGWSPVLKEAFPKILTFPFGESIALTILMSQTKTKGGHKLRNYMWLALLISGAVLTFVAILQVTVLTPDRVKRTVFPLLSVNRYIDVGFLFERLDGVVVFLMMLGLFVKVAAMFYAGLKGVEYVSGVGYRFFAVPVAVLVALTSLLLAGDYMEHITEGLEVVPYYLHLPFQLMLPIILCLLVLWKKRSKRPKTSGGG
ncbi:MAG: spore germination protein [Paenibacillaceae bacterium]|jgi:spore germination protein KB|nr:spore germination protein [Paenibacillaceae bacterium]